MQKFGWKRKIGGQVSKAVSSAFEEEAADEDDPMVASGEVDWLTLAPVKKRSHVIGLEDSQAKAKRLVQDGTVLAGSERYWEALKKWDEALLYTPCDDKIHEMKSQALMELGEVFPAVASARKAVEYAPTWWVAHQTLGRALLGLGEVRMAVLSFSRAVHLNPADRDLWEDDLQWAFSLLQKHRKITEEKRGEKEQSKTGVSIVELDVDKESPLIENDGDILEKKCEKAVTLYNPDKTSAVGDASVDKDRDRHVKRLPNNYIQMRDNFSS